MYMKLIWILQFIVYTTVLACLAVQTLSPHCRFVVHFRSGWKVHSFTIESPSIHALPSQTLLDRWCNDVCCVCVCDVGTHTLPLIARIGNWKYA